MTNSSTDVVHANETNSTDVVHNLGSSDLPDAKDSQRHHVSAEQVESSQSALLNDIATDAKTNISAMILDVGAALHDTQMSRLQHFKYKEFIVKKRKQRLQCLRDMQLHCCQCDGPHISKPPFRHGKDFRRDPIHVQYQADDCLFLKKKQIELSWLDTTLGNYDKNNEQHKLEIEKCKAESQSRKETMKEALKNSLRLMEITSEDLQCNPVFQGMVKSLTESHPYC